MIIFVIVSYYITYINLDFNYTPQMTIYSNCFIYFIFVFRNKLIPTLLHAYYTIKHCKTKNYNNIQLLYWCVIRSLIFVTKILIRGI